MKYRLYDKRILTYQMGFEIYQSEMMYFDNKPQRIVIKDYDKKQYKTFIRYTNKLKKLLDKMVKKGFELKEHLGIKEVKNESNNV